MTSQLVDHCAPSLFCVPKPGGLARIRACVCLFGRSPQMQIIEMM